MTDTSKALEALDRIFNYCEEIDLSLPKEEQIGYDMLVDINIIRETLEKQKIGHWILDETDNSITCDKCDCLIWANDISNGEAYYCPNCGAKMEGK